MTVTQIRPTTPTSSRYQPAGTWLTNQPDTIPTIWGDQDHVIWPKGEALLVCGPTGVGKTTLVSQLLWAILGLTEPTLLGQPVQPVDGHVLYLACDRPAQIRRALRRHPLQDPARLDRQLTIWTGPPDKDLAQHPSELLRMCQNVGATTVIIDSLKDVARKLTDDDTGAGLNTAIQTCLANNIDVAALHHQRKKAQGGEKPKTLDDVYGSNWITAGAGSVLLVWGTAGDLGVTLHHLKPPADPIGPLDLLLDPDGGLFALERGPVDPYTVLAHAPNGITTTDLAQLLADGATITDVHRRKADRHLKRLVDRGVAHRTEPKLGSAPDRPGTLPARYYLVDRRLDDEIF